MTVEAIARKAGPYQYTAGASYPFYYKVFSAEDVAVYVVQDSSEVQLTEDQYTVNLNDDQDNNPGGTVAVSVICESITIVSDVDYTQETVITNRGGFYPDVLNKIHDKLTILIQQILTTLNRTVKIKVTDATSDPDKILDDLRTTASAAAESAAISVSAAQVSADSAATAIATANTAVSKSETAITTADTANATATQALSSIPSTVAETVNTTISGMDIPRLVSDDVDNKIDSLNLDEKIVSEVKDAIAGTEIPGLTPETIAGALGYVPYDAETNSQDFATSAEVGEAIQQAVDAIPEQVNADWNATEGPAQILNKPLIGGAPVGTIGYFAREDMPSGYLLATGQAVGRETYPDLFAAIGTTYGEGDGASTFNLPRLLGDEIGAIVPFASLHMPQDFMPYDGRAISRADYAELFAIIGTTFGAGDGETTFNLPNLIGRFAEGSATPGTVKEAGLPNITGDFGAGSVTKNNSDGTVGNEQLALGGCFEPISAISVTGVNETPSGGWFMNARVGINASRSNITYGKSDTVQPPALTLLPCIKAFDAAIDSGLIDITELANEVAGKADKTEVANLAMPSNSRVDLTFPPNGTTDYVAPADGYFCLSCDASNGFIQILNPNNGLITGYSFGQSEVCRLYLPARKDIGIQVTVSATINNQYGFYFIYANGSQPE